MFWRYNILLYLYLCCVSLWQRFFKYTYLLSSSNLGRPEHIRGIAYTVSSIQTNRDSELVHITSFSYLTPPNIFPFYNFFIGLIFKKSIFCPSGAELHLWHYPCLETCTDPKIPFRGTKNVYVFCTSNQQRDSIKIFHVEHKYNGSGWKKSLFPHDPPK